MNDHENPQDVIDSYKRRQKVMPFLLYVLAGVLVVVGLVVLVIWLTSGGTGKLALFSFKTPTPTITSTPTPIPPTATITQTLTATETAEPSITPTPWGPFEYTVLEDDNCWVISQKFNVPLDLLLLINNFGNACLINPGDAILIPAPGQEMPTETPLPTDIARGTRIEYVVKSGDTMETIAARFNSTIDEIIRYTNIYRRQQQLEQLADKSLINAGDVLIIPVQIVTPTPTSVSTSTPRPTMLGTVYPTILSPSQTVATPTP